MADGATSDRLARHPLFLIISGPPCSGKTTLGQRLGEDLALPFFHKDGIKEHLWDALDEGLRLSSQHLGIIAYEILPYIAEVELRSGRSLIVEANFYSPATAQISHLLEMCSCNATQLYVTAPDDVLVDRSRAREQDASRHSVHAQPDTYASHSPAVMKERNAPLNLPIPLIEIDTYTFGEAEYGRLRHWLRYPSGAEIYTHP